MGVVEVSEVWEPSLPLPLSEGVEGVVSVLNSMRSADVEENNNTMNIRSSTGAESGTAGRVGGAAAAGTRARGRRSVEAEVVRLREELVKLGRAGCQVDLVTLASRPAGAGRVDLDSATSRAGVNKGVKDLLVGGEDVL